MHLGNIVRKGQLTKRCMSAVGKMRLGLERKNGHEGQLSFPWRCLSLANSNKV
jgi:hypothetical protein